MVLYSRTERMLPELAVMMSLLLVDIIVLHSQFWAMLIIAIAIIIVTFIYTIYPFYRSVYLTGEGVIFKFGNYTKKTIWEKYKYRVLLQLNNPMCHSSDNGRQFVVLLSKREIKGIKRDMLKAASPLEIWDYYSIHLFSTVLITVVNDDLRAIRDINKDSFNVNPKSPIPLLNMAEQADLLCFFAENRIEVANLEKLTD